jgi:hypothetical protein
MTKVYSLPFSSSVAIPPTLDACIVQSKLNAVTAEAMALISLSLLALASRPYAVYSPNAIHWGRIQVRGQLA